jgi:ketol-acid reductoisomerase
MALTYQQNKKHIYAWREKNKGHFLEIVRKHQRKYDAWKREKKIFLNILL